MLGHRPVEELRIVQIAPDPGYGGVEPLQLEPSRLDLVPYQSYNPRSRSNEGRGEP